MLALRARSEDSIPRYRRIGRPSARQAVVWRSPSDTARAERVRRPGNKERAILDAYGTGE